MARELGFQLAGIRDAMTCRARRVALATLDGRDKPEFTRPERLHIDRAIPSIVERLPRAPDRLSEAVLGHGRVSPPPR